MTRYQNTSRTWIARLLVSAALAGALVASQGCRSGSSTGLVPISNSEGQTAGPLAVDIQNNRGSVTVIVNPKLEEPKVTAVARGERASEAAQWTAASIAMDAGRPVL